MTPWGTIRAIPIGGLVAVGFLDESRVMVGSHSGLGVFDVETGTLLDRVGDSCGDYDWFQESPPTARYSDAHGDHSVSVSGLWGGTLEVTTEDGWACRTQGAGAALLGPDGSVIAVDDNDEVRACGFSPRGHVFAFATSATLYLSVRALG